MIPIQKVKDIIVRYDNLEKELSSGKVDTKLYAKKSKEYSNLGNIILKSKIEAKTLFNESRQKLLNDINKKKEKLDEEIDKELKIVEAEIEELKNKSPEKINKIAIETSTDLINQLIGASVNNSSITAIVTDVSNKNKTL